MLGLHPRGSKLDADPPHTGVKIPRLFTVDASEVVARFQGGAVDAPVPVIYDARDAADVAPRGTYAEPASPSVPTSPSA